MNEDIEVFDRDGRRSDGDIRVAELGNVMDIGRGQGRGVIGSHVIGRIEDIVFKEGTA